uniref:RRM domain-containing protein n=1 Tax=Schistocephalus solidus TaxID=70667 RepID=A0A0X3PUX7_SCHSO
MDVEGPVGTEKNQYVMVADEDQLPIELPTESNCTLLLSTVQAQFPKCTGLQYEAEESGSIRGVRFSDGCLFPPPDGWGTRVYHCVVPKDSKRKFSENGSDATAKTMRTDGRQCTDLIVLNLPWRTDEDALRKYFSTFGEVVMTQIKRDPGTQQSRGYGFVRFANYQSQALCLAEFRHNIDGRSCEVKIPRSKLEGDRQEVLRKVHVGRITEAMTGDLLREYFSTFGQVMDVFIPTPFRAFAFVTFEDPDVAASLLGKTLTIDNHTVTIGSAVPKLPANRYDRGPRRNLSQPNDWLPPWGMCMPPPYERLYGNGGPGAGAPPFGTMGAGRRGGGRDPGPCMPFSAHRMGPPSNGGQPLNPYPRGYNQTLFDRPPHQNSWTTNGS